MFFCSFLHVKGSAEELIKEELQAVAEGVAASVLQPSLPSNPDLSRLGRSESPSASLQNNVVHNNDNGVLNVDKFEVCDSFLSLSLVFL